MNAPEMTLAGGVADAAGTGTAGDSPARVGSRRKARNFLVDAGLQLRLAGYLVAVAAALSAALGWRIWQAYGEASKLVALGDPRSDEVVNAMLRADDRARILALAGVLVALVVGLLFVAVVVTHRIAGPAVALSHACREVATGSLAPPRPLRRGDFLLGLAADMGSLVDALRAREEAERRQLAEALEATPERAREIVAALAAEKARRLER